MPTITVSFPYNPAMSENARLGYSPRNGKMYAQSGYKQAKANLALVIAFAKASKQTTFAPRLRVWVDLRVYGPSHRFDASNLVKSTNDAISSAIGVNDSLFDGSYRGFVDKKNPRFEITINQ